MNVGESKWAPVSPSVPSEFKWVQLSPGEPKRVSNWVQASPGESNGQMSPSAFKSVQESPRESHSLPLIFYPASAGLIGQSASAVGVLGVYLLY